MGHKLPFVMGIVLLALLVGAVVATAREDDRGNAPSAVQAPSASQPAQPLSPVGTGFTYQGQLRDGGSPANGQFDLQFTLFDAETAGNQVGSPITKLNQTVTDGIFAQTLDFGAGAFKGEARWLEVQVRQSGGTYTTLSPRQAITAVPNALSLVPGSVITGGLAQPALVVTNTNGIGVKGISVSGTGAGVLGESTHVLGYGVYGINNTFSTQARGVVGQSNTGNGVSGLSTTGWGVHGISSSGTGVHGDSTNGTGVHGYSTNGFAIYSEGHAKQDLNAGGIVKAMVRMGGYSIMQCYNSQGITPNVTPPCGFGFTYNTTGDFTITFPFTVNNRFVSVTPEYADNFVAITAHMYFPTANQIRVFTTDIRTGDIDSGFFLIIY